VKEYRNHGQKKRRVNSRERPFLQDCVLLEGQAHLVDDADDACCARARAVTRAISRRGKDGRLVVDKQGRVLEVAVEGRKRHGAERHKVVAKANGAHKVLHPRKRLQAALRKNDWRKFCNRRNRRIQIRSRPKNTRDKD
jgi:hypothetical protein